MANDYMSWVKLLHISCVVLSASGFFIRGIWMMQQSPRLQQRWVKIAPHLIDSLLLISAITLAVQWRFSPLQHPWLAAKIIALLVYIVLGVIALKRGPTLTIRVTTWLAALLTFAYIVGAAMTKSPTFFLYF